jgi:hypothetical protein
VDSSLLFYPNDSQGERRAIENIISPGTDFESDKKSNYIFSILIEKYSTLLYSLFVSITDTVISDYIYTFEYHSTKGN